MAKRLLTYAEAADELGRTPQALRHMVSRGEIAVIKSGRTVRFDMRDLERWINEHRVKAS